MHRRRLVGIVERAVLGAAMTIVLVVVERRLNRPRGRQGAWRVLRRLARWTASRDLIATARAIDEQRGGEEAPDTAGQGRHPARRARRGGGQGGDGQRPAQTEAER